MSLILLLSSSNHKVFKNDNPQLTIPSTSPQQQQEEEKEIEVEKEPEWVAEAMKKKIPPVEVETTYPGIDNITLNYYGKCSDVFKYPPNTNRDLIVFGYGQTKVNYKHLPRFIVSKKNAPNAKILMMVFGDVPSIVHSTFDKLNIQQIVYSSSNGWDASNARFVETYKYLKRHEGEFDRVVSSDFRDVYWLNDFFRTFNSNEVTIMTECFDYKKGINSGCYTVGYKSFLREWVYHAATDRKIADEIIKMKVPNINAGVIAGGIKVMLEFFKVWVDNLEQSKLNSWGYEQSLINILYYTGKMDHIPIVREQCSQRMCFAPGSHNDNLNMAPDQKTITYSVDGCSPVLMHKGVPSSWENP
ncbi:Uncharacterized protein QTN25_010420 [Entamoeba marina]